MAFLRTNCTSLVNKKKKKENSIYDATCFALSFERFLDSYVHAFELAERYAKKILNSGEFDEATEDYARTMLAFIKAYKKGKMELKTVKALFDRKKWERFAIGALNQVHVEYRYRQNGLALF